MRILLSFVTCLILIVPVSARDDVTFPIAVASPTIFAQRVADMERVECKNCGQGCTVCGDCWCAPKVVRSDPMWFALKVSAGNGVGSGTPIYCANGKTLVLTNAHVARQDRTTFTVATHDGKSYPARRVDGSNVRDTSATSIAIDGDDLALVEVDAELGQVEIASELPAVGAPVWVWGYGRDGAPLKTGVVTTNNFADPTLTATLVAVSGDSGSGVFDTKGRLVGVLHGASAGHGMLAVPVFRVRTFVERPLLARLFPRLADRVAAVRAPAVVAGPVTTTPATPAAPACSVYRGPDGKLYQVCPKR